MTNAICFTSQQLLKTSYLRLLPSGDISCCNKNLKNIGDTSRGFTNINRTEISQDPKCSPVHTYRLNPSKGTFCTKVPKVGVVFFPMWANGLPGLSIIAADDMTKQGARASIHYAVRHRTARSRNREIRVKTFPIALKFDRHLSSAAEMPVKYQSDTNIIKSNLVALWLHETSRWDVLPLSE